MNNKNYMFTQLLHFLMLHIPSHYSILINMLYKYITIVTIIIT